MKNKIAIYTICCNEEEHVLQWVKNTKDADIVVVGDTGSTDNTVILLEENGIIVHRINVSPWRFDEARNNLLERLPQDIEICISLDFDERLSAGWREKIEQAWHSQTTRLSYCYSEQQATAPHQISTIISSRIHHRQDYQWVYPVHELIEYNGANKEVIKYVKDLEIMHTPSDRKDRTQYLSLMELAVKENPQDLRLVHQLGRDYMQQGNYDQCIKVMKNNMNIDDISHEQRNACLRFIARAYGEKKQYQLAKQYLLDLIKEAPKCSSAYIEYVVIAYKYQKWDDIIAVSKQCSQIDFNYHSPYNEFFYSESIFYDLISIAYFNVSDNQMALLFEEKALSKDVLNERFKKNIEYYKCLIRN